MESKIVVYKKIVQCHKSVKYYGITDSPSYVKYYSTSTASPSQAAATGNSTGRKVAKLLIIYLFLFFALVIINQVSTGSFYEDRETVRIEKFLLKNFDDWEGLIGIAYSYNFPKDHETVLDYLQRLYEEHGGEGQLADFYAKYFGYKDYEEFSRKFKAKDVLKTLASKILPKLINTLGPKILATKLGRSSKLFLTALHKAATNPVGIGANFVQLALELAGYEEQGSWVGFAGNIFGGAVTGFYVGGHVGAVTGGTVGYGAWKFGEVASPQAIGWLKTLVRCF